MNFSYTVLLALANISFAYYVPSEPWQDLAPTTTLECSEDMDGKTFGIVVETSYPRNEKRDENAQAQFRTSPWMTMMNLVTQISDGQIQDTNTLQPCEVDYIACPELENTLSMTLVGDVLYDKEGRIGSIVSNHQFQFDGPVPQAGTIYAAGWAVTKEGYLALGDKTWFYECNSGDFYNLYDEEIADYCIPIELKVVEFHC